VPGLKVALLSIFKTLRFHPTLHGRVAGCFGTGASTERLVPLVGYLGLIGSRPQLQPVGPAPSHTLCFDFGWHAPSLALGCDENVALSPWHFAAEASVQRARSGGLSSGLQSRRSRFCHPLLQSGHLPANPQTNQPPTTRLSPMSPRRWVRTREPTQASTAPNPRATQRRLSSRTQKYPEQSSVSCG
jgi:hypothetical protein